MAINSISAPSRNQAASMPKPRQVDNVSKEIQNRIISVQQQMQQISSNPDIPAEEKMKRRQELQQELANLNAQLRQHQADVHREERKETVERENAAKEQQAAEIRKQVVEDTRVKDNSSAETKYTRSDNTAERMEKNVPASTDRTMQAEKAEKAEAKAENNKVATGTAAATLSKIAEVVNPDPEKEAEKAALFGRKTPKEQENDDAERRVKNAVEGSASIKQARQKGSIVSKIKDASMILKSEIRQDEMRNVNVESKKSELAKQEKRLNQAQSSNFSTPNNSGNVGKVGKAGPQVSTDNNDANAKTTKSFKEGSVSVNAPSFPNNNDSIIPHIYTSAHLTFWAS